MLHFDLHCIVVTYFACQIHSVQELSTIAMPTAFLPLACTANLAKNLAAVAASSTRAPIYKTFALQNNLAGANLAGMFSRSIDWG